MSNANLNRFAEIVNADPELQRRICDTPDVKELARRAVQEGSARGFEFTAAEVEAAFEEPTVDLNVRDLDFAAGAGGTRRLDGFLVTFDRPIDPCVLGGTLPGDLKSRG